MSAQERERRRISRRQRAQGNNEEQRLWWLSLVFVYTTVVSIANLIYHSVEVRNRLRAQREGHTPFSVEESTSTGGSLQPSASPSDAEECWTLSAPVRRASGDFDMLGGVARLFLVGALLLQPLFIVATLVMAKIAHRWQQK